jgi:hypothetical protein
MIGQLWLLRFTFESKSKSDYIWRKFKLQSLSSLINSKSAKF